MLIIDMPMPKYCADCPMIALSDRGMICLCTEALLEIDYDKKRPSWCPIKGVLPEQHGDLIDADTVLWGEEVPDSEGIVVPVTIGDVIEGYDVPIIIAAERKDDEQIH